MSGRIIIKTPTSMIEIDDTLLIEFLGGKLDASTSAEVEASSFPPRNSINSVSSISIMDVGVLIIIRPDMKSY